MPLPENHLFFGFADKLTNEQRDYINSMIDYQVTMVNAVAGSGKTTLAVGVARILEMELIYIHPTVEEKRLGFTPGTEFDKIAKYHQPLKDALLEIREDPNKAIYNENNMDIIKSGKAWVYPMSDAFLRGSTIKGNKFVLIDEAQNFTYHQLRKIFTRIADDCKVVVCGHTEQCDLEDPSQSGFLLYLNYFKHKPYVNICELSKNFRGRFASDADVSLETLKKASN